MGLHLSRDNYRTYRAYRDLLDDKLTELALYAKELCPEAVVEVSATSYEDEDGHVDIFPPPSLPEEEEERIELAVAARAAEIFEETGLFILCAAFDPPDKP
ncbi:MAG TPA: hypothetical protein VKK81_24290 [Candidatus Binatia bacterium]|nr:hypothetical protein [Candidatus Binatia bacterium]